MHLDRIYIQYIHCKFLLVKFFWIYFLAFLPFQAIGMVNANTIQPGFLAERHAKTINSKALGSEEFLKFKGTCGKSSSCVIGINGESLITSSGIRINSDRIIGWTLTNATNKGGVLFVGKNEDYRFLIKSFNSDGQRKLNEIGFFNFKSAQSFLSSLELLSGLSANHDQAGQTTKCTARGKDALSGSDMATIDDLDRNTLSLSSLRNTQAGALAGGTTGAIIGDLVGSTSSIATGSIIGGLAGAVVGDSLGRSSGGLSLKRNVISDIRATPASSKAFLDDSFTYRSECIDEPLNSSIVDISSPIPVDINY